MPDSIGNTWRMDVQELDRSSTVKGTALTVGAMVIKASRGNTKPVKIYKGQENRLLKMFGKPSSSYPDVYEAIQFNNQDDIWISAPYDTDARLGGVLVSESGSAGLGLGNGETPGEVQDYSFNSDNDLFLIAAKNPAVDWLGVKITRNSTSGFFTIKLYETTDSGTTWTEIDEYVISITVNEKDGFGTNIYGEVLLLDNDYIEIAINANADPVGWVDDTDTVAFSGGLRGSAITITEINEGWAYFQQINTYEAGIFMDPTSVAGVETTFNTLRNTYQKYASYILKLPDSEAAATTLLTKDGFSINNAGLSWSCNWARVTDSYNNSSFWTSLIGKIGAKFAQMADIYNGGAPAWIDENNHGGQLGPGVIEMRYDYTESQLEAFDVAGINPIVFYQSYGVMVVSQKTAQSPNTLSDNSWIAHRRLFDYIISNTISQVLTYQIAKLNDDLHQTLADTKGRTILDPIFASGLLFDYEIVCNSSNNDANAREQRKFIYDLFVKVTPYSETIQFKFINVGQTTDIKELISG